MITRLNWDKYTQFQFGEFNSIEYNTYIVRNGEKLSFFNEDKKGVEQYSTSNKNFVYYGGATYNVKSKEVSMVAICGNRDEFRKIMTFLNTGRRERLVFGEDEDWNYDAVITNVSAATYYDDGRELVVEWKVTFGLFGDGEAYWRNLSSYTFGDNIENSIDNDLGLPLIVPANANPNSDWYYTYYLFSQGNGHNYITLEHDITVTDTTKYEIYLNCDNSTSEEKRMCSYTLPEETLQIHINGKVGAYKNANKFLEAYDVNGFNEGRMWFKNKIIENFSNEPNLEDYNGKLLIEYNGDAEEGKIRVYLINITENSINKTPIYSSPGDSFDATQYTIISPVILKLTYQLQNNDKIYIEKHNNF